MATVRPGAATIVRLTLRQRADAWASHGGVPRTPAQQRVVEARVKARWAHKPQRCYWVRRDADGLHYEINAYSLMPLVKGRFIVADPVNRNPCHPYPLPGSKIA